MLGTSSRRRWLRDAALLTVGAALPARLHRMASAIEPLQRVGGAKFKFSLAAYSYRDLLTGDSPKLTLEDFIRDCATMGLEGTELTSYYFPPEPSNEYLVKLKRLAFELGLDVSGTAVGNDFCYPPGAERDKELNGVKQWIGHAAALDAPVIRIFSGNAKDSQSDEAAHRLAVAGIEECCAVAGEHGVMLALENHGGLTNTADGMLKLVHDVQSPWFGVNLDTGNFRTSDPYGDLARLAPFAVNVQVKVMMQPEGAAKSQADYARLAKMLADVGYRGYIVLEFEEDEDPRVACPRHLGEMRAAFTPLG
ncbi:MAG: sugar phosphate isomerase/epimerase family protein [Planctomycetia bacterium]|nr:sugar phosphate isomerase/epimerase family protein [Planctomycetia bacterium]